MCRCAVCGERTLGRITYVSGSRARYPMCSDCCWRFGNISDFARYVGRLPTFSESKRRRRGLAAVVPRSRRHYRQLCRLWLRDRNLCSGGIRPEGQEEER